MGKKTLAIVGAAIAFVLAAVAVVVVGPVLLIALLFQKDPEVLAELCQRDSTSGAEAVFSGDLSNFDLPEQKENAGKIIDIGTKRGFGYKGVMIALSTAGQESKIRNLTHGDRDSLGIFQQRPSQGWGTEEQVTNPDYAINAFYDALDKTDWRSPSVSYMEAALAVQRPDPAAYLSPDNYFPNHVAAAAKILANYKGSTSTTSTVDTTLESPAKADACQQVLAYTNELEAGLPEVVQAARTRLGTINPWEIKPGDKNDGALFVSWAFAQADIKVPNTIGKLAAYEGDEKAGISTKWYSAEDIRSGAVKPEPADIPCYSEVPNPTRKDCQYVGVFENAASSINGLTVATFNVQGSSHTAKSGPQSGPNRMVHQFPLIQKMGSSVVGLQELQRNQRAKLLELVKQKGNGYGIYPETANYGKAGRAPGIESVNSILYDKSQVEVVSRSSRPMPHYFNGNEKSIPLLRLKHLASGQEFYFMDTHDPADVKCRCAKYRKGNADARAEQNETLIREEGIPVIDSGDFNAGFKVKHKGNVTLGGVRENLTHCIITKSGTMVNSYDAFKHQSRSECTPGSPRGPPDNPIDHIFVSRGVEVTRWETINKQTAKSDHAVRWIAIGTPGQAGPPKASKLGYYIAVGPTSGSVQRMPLTTTGLAGILHITISPPETAVADGKWVLPITPPYRLTAGFGKKGDLWSADHTGQDFATSTGTPIHAAASGEVISTQKEGAYGNKTVIKLPDGTETWYCHQNEFAVGGGQQVAAGDIIGYVGSTGNTTGPHLHFEVRRPDGTAVDPMAVLENHGADADQSGS